MNKRKKRKSDIIITISLLLVLKSFESFGTILEMDLVLVCFVFVYCLQT